MAELAEIEYTKEGRVALVTLDRPESMNAMSRGLLAEMAEAFDDVMHDPAVHVAVLTGAGRAFCAGMDMREHASAGGDSVAAPAPAASVTNPFWDPGGAPRTLTKPVVAAVNGYAGGGGFLLATSADLVLAAESARFELAFPLRGIPGGWDLVLRLGLSLATALELAVGERLSARRAYDAGLVNGVVPDESLLAEARELAERIAARPPLAVRANVELVRRTLAPVPPEVERRFRDLLDDARRSEDARESFASFLERRPPSYRGR